MPTQGDVIFELQRLGNAVRVSALDVATLTEVVIMAPAHTPEPLLKQQALQKLRYVLAKRSS